MPAVADHVACSVVGSDDDDVPLPPKTPLTTAAAAPRQSQPRTFILAYALGVLSTVALWSAAQHSPFASDIAGALTGRHFEASRPSSADQSSSSAASGGGGGGGGGGGRIPTLGRDVAAFVTSVNAYVAVNVTDTPWPAEPNPMPPLQIPYVDRLAAAAGKLNSNPSTAQEKLSVASKMFMIKTRLGRATDVGNKLPPQASINHPVLDDFPNAHHFHQGCGFEWYYVAAKMPIQETTGQRRRGEASVLVSMERNRAVSYDFWDTQLKGKVPGWESDGVNQLSSVVATVTARFFANGDSGKVERTVYATNEPNAAWAAVDPEAMSFSVPGEAFAIRMGNFSLTSQAPAGSRDILPLTLSARDPSFAFDFTIHKRSDVVADGFFLQGYPVAFKIGSHGNGFTTAPNPGLYYSWPQLAVYGATTMSIAGETVEVTGVGNGWIDHQLMAKTLKNPADASGLPAVQPVPFRQDSSPVNGWMWQFCNADNGTSAWTGANFVLGNPQLSPLGLNPYGYFIELKDGKWDSSFTAGATLSIPMAPGIAPAGAEEGAPFTTKVPVPNARTYWELRVEITATGFWAWLEFLRDFVLSDKGYLSADAHGWETADFDVPHNRSVPMVGDFNNGDFSMAAEVPATFTDPFGDPYGWGYLETVGFEPTADEAARMLHYLETDIPSGLSHVKRTGA